MLRRLSVAACFLLLFCFCGDDDGAAGAAGAPDGGPGTPGTGPGGALPDGGFTPGDPTPVPVPPDPSKCPSGSGGDFGAGHHSGFSSGGQKRSFDVLVPAASFTGPRPLLFAFHGTGLSGARAIEDYHLQEWADAGAIVVAPDSNGNGALWPVWDSFVPPGAPAHANPDLALFDDLLACVAVHQSVDAKRIYVAGQSAGGAMSNFMLGQRSAVLAGGIPASGVFDLTQPTPKAPVDPVTVIVTWGGKNDVYSGGAGDAEISNIGFYEQSTLASQYWEAQPGSHQIACTGAELGHTWLGAITGWMRDILLAHPKGSAVIAGESLPPLPSNPKATCTEQAAVYQPAITVDCPSSATNGCHQYCQLLGDCLVENGSMGPVLASEIRDVGYGASGNVCSGCISDCVADANGSAVDAAVLSCLATSAPTTQCGPGVAGAAALTTINQCCNKTASKVCARFCTAFKKSALFAATMTGCP